MFLFHSLQLLVFLFRSLVVSECSYSILCSCVILFHSLQLHLAQFIARIFPKHGLIIEVDTRGQITRSLHDEGGEVIESISHVLDIGDRLLLGSYEAPHGAVVSL